MANKKISQLDALGAAPAATDIIPVTDVSDTTGSNGGTTKRVTVAELLTNAPDNSTDVTLATVASNYLTLSGQEITANTVPVSLGGTGGTDAATARTNLGLGTAATTDSADYATASHAHAINDLSDVTITNASNEDVIKFNGTSFVNGQVSVDVQAPLNLALRGTENPHIGAYPNQPFNALENSAQSVMVITNSAGELDFLIPDGGNLFLNSPSGGRVSPSFGFSVSEDANEPDIEVAGTLAGSSENYSVISGDSDSVGLNGLPIRQGFNNPDIGANPAPILISGGSIA